MTFTAPFTDYNASDLVPIVPPNACLTATCAVPAYAQLERIVLPRLPLILEAATAGIRLVVDRIPYDRLVSIEGPSPFEPVDLFPGQLVKLTVSNPTTEPVRLEGAFCRFRGLSGHFVTNKEIEALRDRGKALQASADTEIYGRGWTEAVDRMFASRIFGA